MFLSFKVNARWWQKNLSSEINLDLKAYILSLSLSLCRPRKTLYLLLPFIDAACGCAGLKEPTPLSCLPYFSWNSQSLPPWMSSQEAENTEKPTKPISVGATLQSVAFIYEDETRFFRWYRVVPGFHVPSPCDLWRSLICVCTVGASSGIETRMEEAIYRLKKLSVSSSEGLWWLDRFRVSVSLWFVATLDDVLGRLQLTERWRQAH